MVVDKKQLKKRSIFVYLTSVEMTDRWKTLVERSGRTISKFVSEHVENSLRQEEEGSSSYKSRAELRVWIRRLWITTFLLYRRSTVFWPLRVT